MSTASKHRAGIPLAGGIVAGIVIGLVVPRLGGYTLIRQLELDEQRRQIAGLEKENLELTDDLFAYKGSDAIFDTSDLPYDDDIDAAFVVAGARRQALENHKFLMVTFGANWCLDCRTLYHHLQSPEVRAFTDGTFDFVNVSVGKFNINADLARDLGVDLGRGIPVAVFFGPDGQVIGTTNEGQLEPARYYSSRQILKFVRDIVNKSVIAAPDSVQ